MYLGKWAKFTHKKGISQFSTTLGYALEFLTELYEGGLGYSGINTAKSALASCVTVDNVSSLGEHPLVKKFMRGIFNMRPSLPRYKHVWDVNIVLLYLKNLGATVDLSLKHLTMKLTMLLGLLAGQRCQTLNMLNYTDIFVNSECVTFDIKELLKQSASGKKQTCLKFYVYNDDVNLCVVRTLVEYLKRTLSLRQGSNNRLLLSFQKPHKPVTKTTVSRWLTEIMSHAGINTKVFKPHSIRAASCSKAKEKSTAIADIIETAGWSNARTFAKFYDKPIQDITARPCAQNSFANAVLSND